MTRIIEVKARENYCLYVVFSDGLEGEIELGDRLFGPMFEPLKDADFFRQVAVDEFGAICWPNGADLAPDAIYNNLQQLLHQRR